MMQEQVVGRESGIAGQSPESLRLGVSCEADPTGSRWRRNVASPRKASEFRVELGLKLFVDASTTKLTHKLSRSTTRKLPTNPILIIILVQWKWIKV